VGKQETKKSKKENEKKKNEIEIEIEKEILGVKLKLTIIIIKCLIFAALYITFRDINRRGLGEIFLVFYGKRKR